MTRLLVAVAYTAVFALTVVLIAAVAGVWVLIP